MKLETRRNESFLVKYILSSISAAVAETCTYPIDLTKTRLQIQGEKYASLNNLSKTKTVTLAKNPHRGMTRTMLGIATEEGVLKVWQGLPPAVYRHIVYTGCRMMFYEIIREDILHKDEEGRFALWKSVVGGMTAGGAAQFIASPTDLVKVRMQMEGRRKLEGLPPRYKNTWAAFRSIYLNSGIRGLWSGWVPNVQRACLVNCGELATYDLAKHFLLRNTRLKDNYITHSLSSILTSIVAALLGTPADVVKSRVMNQPIDSKGTGLIYKSSWHCLSSTVKNEGFLALYKGLFPTWIRMAPWSLTFWVTYEQIRRLFGVSSF